MSYVGADEDESGADVEAAIAAAMVMETDKARRCRSQHKCDRLSLKCSNRVQAISLNQLSAHLLHNRRESPIVIWSAEFPEVRPKLSEASIEIRRTLVDRIDKD